MAEIAASVERDFVATLALYGGGIVVPTLVSLAALGHKRKKGKGNPKRGRHHSHSRGARARRAMPNEAIQTASWPASGRYGEADVVDGATNPQFNAVLMPKNDLSARLLAEHFVTGTPRMTVIGNHDFSSSVVTMDNQNVPVSITGLPIVHESGKGLYSGELSLPVPDSPHLMEGLWFAAHASADDHIVGNMSAVADAINNDGGRLTMEQLNWLLAHAG